MYLMDINILVYAHREDVDKHNEFRYWLESVINGNADYGYSELVLSGFLRVVTHPKVFETPTPLEKALEFVNQIKSQKNAVKIIPKNGHWAIFEDLVSASNAKGNLIPDAYHAALAIESGCQWVTSDRGFRKFKGLKTKFLFNN